MEHEELKIAVGSLKEGMFVYRLDREWLGTPFPLQGFEVCSSEDIDQLSRFCEHVYIDVLKSRGIDKRLLWLAALPRVEGETATLAVAPDDSDPIAALVRNPIRYRNTVSLAEELPHANAAHVNAKTLASKIMEDVRAGRKMSAADVSEAVGPVVKSILRNVDAFFWIASLRKRDAYVYSHAINSSMLAAAFGRHLGFPEEVLISLASGGLLLDVGKADLPEVLLTHPGPLSEQHTQRMQKHVEYSLRIFDESGSRDDTVRDMIATHHERHDGSGYPKGLRENQISLFGRMAAVIDTYDAMSSDRTYQKTVARHEALQHIYRGRGKQFQGEVVEQFLQCLSIYPTGSLVELSTGQVGIVMAQNPARRLRPRVMILMNSDKQLDSNFAEIDLMTYAMSEGASPIEIVGTLEPGAYGLDPAELYLG